MKALLQEKKNSRSRRTLILIGLLVSLSSVMAVSQNLPLQPSDAIALQGTVRTSTGDPVTDASVLLEEKSQSRPAETKTNAEGIFTFSVHRPGSYTLRTQKSGFRMAVTDSLVLSAGEQKHINVILEALGTENRNSPGMTTPSSTGGMEFEDKPNFTIAGVTDWTAAGGHGADTNLRTSEELAKDTLALKSDESKDSPFSTNPAAEYDLALKYKASGDFKRAGELVRSMLATENKADLHRLLSEIDEHLNDPLGAVQESERAVRLDPSEQNFFQWGSVLLLHRAIEPAVEVFGKGAATHPKSARMLSGLGAALYANGSYDEAALRLCAASDLRPADPTPYLFLGRMESAAPRPLPCVEQKMTRFVKDQPADALANYYYAMTIWKRQKGSESPAGLQQVESFLNKAVALDPKFDEAYLQLGVLYSDRGNLEPAITAYKKACELNPHLSEAHYRLGVAYKRLGRETDAEQEFQAHEQIEKTEAVAVDRQRREVRQFLFTLRNQPETSAPH
jgi:Flp pilus assembly protein TadD